MPTEVVAGPDAAALEEDLLARIDRAKRKKPFAPFLVIAPSQAVLWRVRRALLSSGRAYLNLYLLHHQALAERILLSAGEPVPRVAGEATLLALARGLLGKGDLADYAKRFPGALASLLGALNDLREALLSAREAAAPLRKTGLGELASLYAAYEKALQRMSLRSGLADRTEPVLRAIRAAPKAPLLRDACGIVQIGAYETVPAHAALLDACGRATPLAILAPGVGAGPAFAYARRTMADWPAGAAPAAPARGVLSPRLDRLYAEEGEPLPPLPEEAVTGFTAGGTRAELEAAARRILRLADSGVPLHAIGVVARTLEPYAVHLDAVFEAFGLPYVTSLRAPLASRPAAEALATFARTLDGDFPRADLAALFANPAFRAARALPRGARAEPSRWDWMAREARVDAGRTGWMTDLPTWAAARDGRARARETRAAGALAEAVKALAQEADRWDSCRRWTEHAAFLRAALRNWIAPDDAQTVEAIEAAVDELGRMEAVDAAIGRRAAVPRAEARAHLEALLAQDVRQGAPRAEEGVQVLDAMQARAVPFRHLFLIGLSADQWPRKPHPDPFLPDAARRTIEKETGRRLPLQETALEEDRQIFATLLGAAGESLVFSYARADEAGRGRSHATLLREIARLKTGRPDAGALIAAASLLPADPAALVLLEASKEPAAAGLVTEREALLAAAARGGAGELAALAARLGFGEALADGATYVAATNRWEPDDLSFDGAVGAREAAGRHMSARQIETLGRCPLQYFFEYVLSVPRSEPRDDPSPLPWELGLGAHAVLEWIHDRLRAEGLLPCRDAARPLARARALLAEGFEERFTAPFAAVRDRFPVLWKAQAVSWRAALARFLEWDLERLAREGAVPQAVEKELKEEVRLPTRDGPRPVLLRGRIDRMDAYPDGALRVVDYKTSGDVKRPTNPTQILKGERPQLALYFFLAETAFPDRKILAPMILPVSLDDAQEEEPGEEKGDEPPTLELPPLIEEAVGDTLFTLADLPQRGLFPLREGNHCRWCAYAAACRRSHPPTRNRNDTAPIFAGYLNLRNRNTKDPYGQKKGGKT